MLDALNRAERYRELAEGCRRLAAIAFSTETRNHFVRMAEHYRTLAEADEPGPPPVEGHRAEVEHT
jgi:hypothetical protein